MDTHPDPAADTGPSLVYASDAWFDRARALTAALPSRPGVGWRLQFDATGDAATGDAGTHHRWHQVVEDGRVVAWAAGEVDRPDLEVRFAWAHGRAVHRGERSGTEALGALRVVSPDGVESAPPPMDIGDTAELGRLPPINGATLTTQYEFSRGPFGPVSWWWSFDDGRSSGMDFGAATDPDVVVRISFQKMVKVRTGAITILEALEDGGRVEGDVGPLMLLAGLEESEELHAAELACGPAGAVLAQMGDLAATTEYQTAMAALARETQ